MPKIFLRSTEDDKRFMDLRVEWGFEIAGPSERRSFLVLDGAGKAWLYTCPDWRRLRDVVEALWTPYNVAFMNRGEGIYPWPCE